MTSSRGIDVVVIGGGTVGAWTAVQLAERGAGHVVLLEAQTLGDGASSRAAGMVRAQGGTEAAFTGEYWDDHTEGVYACRACGAELFRSQEKFDSHCGWPSFYAPLAQDRVEYIEDRSMGTKRVEVRCAHCGSHLGHVFEGEGYDVPTDQRYCINSVSLRLEPAPEQA